MKAWKKFRAAGSTKAAIALGMAGILAMPMTAIAETATVSYQNTAYLVGDFMDPWNLEMDASGNYYHSGGFVHSSPVNFNPAGSDPRTATANENGYITKYNANGTYAWTRTVAGPSQDLVMDSAADSNGNVYAVGSFQGANANFDELGSELHTSNGSSDGFITKFNASGTHQWTITNGGAGLDAINSVAVDPAGDIIVKGTYTGTMDFDPGAGTNIHTSTAFSWDSFVSKYSKDGVYQWSILLSGSDYVDGELALDESGNMYVAGGFRGTVDFDPGVGVQSATAAGNDAFILKLNPTGVFGWLRVITGAGDETIDGLAVRGGSVAIGGSYSSASVNFNPTGSDVKSRVGTDNAFVSRWNTDGTYAWTRSWGTATTNNEDVAIDTYGDVYATGTFSGTNVNFNPGGSLLRSTAAGEDDIFITKFTKEGAHQWAKTSLNGDTNFAVGIRVSDALDVVSFGQVIADPAGTNLNPDGTALFGDGSTFDIYLTRWNQTVTQAIQNVPSNIALQDTSGNAVSPTSFSTGAVVQVKLVDSATAVPIVLAPLELTTDVDWSGVTMGTDAAAGKTFVHGLSAATGTSGNHTLYIPKLAGQNAVIICPDATNLSEVTASCTNKQEYRESDPNVTLETVGGQEYWVVSGLSGTGGLGTVLAANTALVQTGVNGIVGFILALALIGLPVVMYWRVRRPATTK